MSETHHTVATLPAGIYRIHSSEFVTDKGTSLTVGLPGGGSADGASTGQFSFSLIHRNRNSASQIAAREEYPSSLGDLWLVTALEKDANETSNQYYTLQNVLVGTFMNLRGDCKDDKTEVIGFQRGHSKNENWALEYLGAINNKDCFRIINESSGTCLQAIKSCCENSLTILAYHPNPENVGPETWYLSKTSFDHTEIEHILNERFSEKSQSTRIDIKTSRKSKIFFGMSQDLLRDIWIEEDVESDTVWDNCSKNDAAFHYKATVARWADNNVKAENVSPLCGIVFCEKSNSTCREFNWTIDPYTLEVIFFDSQTGVVKKEPWGFEVKFVVY